MKNWEDLFTIWRTYHFTASNRIVHAIGIPISTFALFVILQFFPPYNQSSDFCALNWPFTIMIVASQIFVKIHYLSGSISSVLLIVFYALSRLIYISLDDKFLLWKISIGTFLFTVFAMGVSTLLCEEFLPENSELVWIMLSGFVMVVLEVLFDGLKYKPKVKESCKRSSAKVRIELRENFKINQAFKGAF